MKADRNVTRIRGVSSGTVGVGFGLSIGDVVVVET
jgi:hypothetical protein